MSGLDKVREEVTRFLKGQGIAALTAWPDEARKRPTGAVVAVSVRACKGAGAGFSDYLGERFDEGSGTWRERYGKLLTLTLGLDIYAPKKAGAALCQRAFDALVEAVTLGAPEGLTLGDISRGQVQYDGVGELFYCPAEVTCEAYLYALAEEDGVLLDFEIGGKVE